MPTVPVSDNGTVLYYEDSGAPPGSDYVTLVLVHGTCFHGAVYRPMIPYAAAHNLRLVLLNMRGYPGSTPYTQGELESLKSDLETQQTSLAARGAEIAAFLRWFIETEKLPPIREDTGSERLVGGLSLLSWSGGNGPMLAMFAHADKLAGETRQLLNLYLRSFVIYDPSSTAVGCPAPPGIKNVIIDPSVPLEEQAWQFGLHVGSFYPPFTLPDKLPDERFEQRPPRLALQDTAALTGASLDPKHVPTVSEPKMTKEEFQSMTHPSIMDRTQHAIWSPVIRQAFAANVVRALYDCRLETHDGSGMRKPVWPAVKVHLVWCDMTLGEAAWGAAVVKCGYEEAKPETRRPVEFHVLDGANHFVHWEEPERFVKFLVGIV